MKKGQMQISFGMIVSIILIIFFLAFAFFGIRTFLGIQTGAKSVQFITDFREDVDKAWKSAQVSQEYEYGLPSSIESVCFVDFNVSARGVDSAKYKELKTAYFSKENMVFWPVEHSETEAAEIKNLDLAAMTAQNNPLCIKTEKSEIKVRITKDISDALVTVSEA